ncbi:peptidoglycan binding domain containing protein [Cordyceps fumosorosea ARSEF 2679]|uniref:Peptidoglycan binding domain containing protein n=1 Tax=Cordyceps fumosorosea (strain ARSEF 2679) TaxID=1081104 RepID=A0A162JDM0_CORFA|nr:peptidoglycan binding domain containing protein [Cordyceps fumosorosea ARSEF 2679]OAA67402.1 peptidoglycan binding domain containing protein [Cordyceps fumosorosea ARSEF 2679]
MANITLAWMMDQMASVGVEFHAPSALRMISQQIQQYEAKAAQLAAAAGRSTRKPPPPWAVDAIFRANAPVRPWALGALQKPPSVVDWITGRTSRTPGQYRQADPRTGDDRRGAFLRDTNERVHSSARVRLACRGLGLNDQGGVAWAAPTLTRRWRLRRTTARYEDPVPRDPLWDPAEASASEVGRKPNEEQGERWIWEYVGPEEEAPTEKRQRIMVEEPLGPYERFLLNQVGGKPNVYAFAEGGAVSGQLSGSVNGLEQDSEAETETGTPVQNTRSPK